MEEKKQSGTGKDLKIMKNEESRMKNYKDNRKSP